MISLELLKNYIASFVSFPVEHMEELAPFLSERVLEKSEFFVKQGEDVEDVGIVLSGVLRKFYQEENGIESVKDFEISGSFVGEYGALLTEDKARFSIQALLETRIITIKYSDLRRMFEADILWSEFGRKIAERVFLEKEKRERSFLLLDAKARYLEFLADYPNLIKEIPHYHIASYLGVTNVTLSRLRSSES